MSMSQGFFHFVHLEMNKVLGFGNFKTKKRGNCMHFKLQCNISEIEEGIFAFCILGNEKGFRILEL